MSVIRLILWTVLFLEIVPFAAAQVTPRATCISTCSGNLGDNIFPDGDFGSGIPNVVPNNPNLAPGYSYQKIPPPNDGSYSIANSTVGWGSFAANTWIKIEDNGPEVNGYMMVVNASYQPGLFYRKVVTVCENTLYEFSIDVIAMNIPSPNFSIIQPDVAFEIDSVIVCSTNNIPIDATWHNYRFSFTTKPGVTQVTLSLRNNAPGGFGNDLAIDNISFRACGPNIDVPATAFFCVGQPLALRADLTDSPYADLYYQWQFQSPGSTVWQNVPGANTQQSVAPMPQNGEHYRLVVANTPGNLGLPNCSAVSDPVEGVLDDVSGFAIGGSDTILCNGTPAVLQAGNFAQYQWSTGAKTAVINAPTPGWYGVSVTNAHGCVATDSLYVFEVNLTAEAGSEDPVCAGDSTGRIRIENWQGGAGTVRFSLGDGPVQDQPFFDGLPGGTYLATVSDSLHCRFEIPIQITDPPPLVLSLGGKNTLYACDSLRFNASANFPLTDYSWQPAAGVSCQDCPDPLVMPLKTTLYSLTATDERGCRSTDSLLLTVLPRLDVYAPNVFRPSVSDHSENNVFTLFPSKSAVFIRRLDIYNRWGELVFQVRDQAPGAQALQWDGTDRHGRPLTDGVFVWLSEIEFTDGQTRMYSGDVTLLSGK
ncbi:MAG: gliding motility-associated C-terminal domain-containing protein [Saprospiraceae bacterium]|nr:gliding motility-associated C-terminal domain-containing protein [Saprospiraceae bacterium]